MTAARDILGRNGIANTQRLEVLLKPWEQDLGDLIVGDVDDEPLDVVDAEGPVRGGFRRSTMACPLRSASQDEIAADAAWSERIGRSQ